MSITDGDLNKEQREFHWTDEDENGWYRYCVFSDMLTRDNSLDEVDREILRTLTERDKVIGSNRSYLKYGTLSITKAGWAYFRDMIVNGNSLRTYLDKDRMDYQHVYNR